MSQSLSNNVNDNTEADCRVQYPAW